MSKFCGQTVTISEVVDDLYGILEDDGDYSWADYMIECLIEPAIENKPQEKMISLDRACEYLESVLEHNLGYYGAADFANTFRKAMEV